MRDLVYIDAPKLASLLSQAEGGLVREHSETVEGSTEVHGEAKLALLQLMTGRVGGTIHQRDATTASRVLHHDLLLRVEEALADAGLLIDLPATGEQPRSAADARRLVAGAAGIRCTGSLVVEDYERVKALGEKANPLIESLNAVAQRELRQTPELVELEEQVAALEAAVDGAPKEKRREARKHAKEARERLEQATALATPQEEEQVPEEYLTMLQRVGDMFLGSVVFRLRPFPNIPNFEIVGDLSEDHFLDNLDRFRFNYGSTPDLPFSVLGLLTSLPVQAGQAEALATESEETGGDSSMIEVLGGLNRMAEQVEQMVRASRWPQVVVYPLAIYRELGPDPPTGS